MRPLLGSLLPFLGLFQIFRRLTRVPEFRALMLSELGLLLSGTLFYHFVEKWDWLDAMYFCIVTLATVGYGDLHPTTPWGKIFTIPYIILGVALLGVFIQIAGKTAFESLQERVDAKRAAQESSNQPST